MYEIRKKGVFLQVLLGHGLKKREILVPQHNIHITIYNEDF